MTLNDFENKVNDLWNNHRWAYILVAIPVALFFCRNIIINLLLANSKVIDDEAQKKSNELKKEEVDANTQANQIIKTADETKSESDEQQVDDHWYEKK